MVHQLVDVPGRNPNPGQGERGKRPSLRSRAALGSAVTAGLLVTLGPPPAAGQGDRTTGVSFATQLADDSKLDPSAMRVATPCERGPKGVTKEPRPLDSSGDPALQRLIEAFDSVPDAAGTVASDSCYGPSEASDGGLRR